MVFGGVSRHGQIQALRRGVEVLVATPGRLLDLMSEGVVKLDPYLARKGKLDKRWGLWINTPLASG